MNWYTQTYETRKPGPHPVRDYLVYPIPVTASRMIPMSVAAVHRGELKYVQITRKHAKTRSGEVYVMMAAW